MVRYTHYSLMVTGPYRLPIVEFLQAQATESLMHAQQAGEFLTGLEGHPSLKIAEIEESHKHDIRAILEEAPPEISADLVDSGVTLVGGGSLLHGIEEAIADALGIPAKVVDDPLTAVARGTGIFLEKLDVFAKVLASEEED